jgi:dolichol-phosphate mannosyltransferase
VFAPLAPHYRRAPALSICVPTASILLALAAVQAAAGARVLWRLLPGRRRTPPVLPLVDPADPRQALAAGASVSVVVAALNEAHRIGPCLAGLLAQGGVVREILVVDSRSTDGTRALVEAAAARDPRVRLLTDPPLEDGWVGKVWALEHGRRAATGDWIPRHRRRHRPRARPGRGGRGGGRAARAGRGELRAALRRQTAGERWLQPAMLATLVYRTGAPTPRPRAPGDVLANGQCFLVRRALLEAHGGYASARASWADDVALARHLMRRGARVGFLDGARLFTVRAYAGAREAWREWGRSFDLADASAPSRQALDLATVTLAQGVPLLVVLAFGAALWAGGVRWGGAAAALLAVNAALVGVRVGVLAATRGSYARRGAPYWLSVTADPAAVARLWLSTLRRPRAWRGRPFALAADGA